MQKQNKKTGRRCLALLMTLAMLGMLLPMGVMTVSAADPVPVSYLVTTMPFTIAFTETTPGESAVMFYGNSSPDGTGNQYNNKNQLELYVVNAANITWITITHTGSEDIALVESEIPAGVADEIKLEKVGSATGTPDGKTLSMNTTNLTELITNTTLSNPATNAHKYPMAFKTADSTIYTLFAYEYAGFIVDITLPAGGTVTRGSGEGERTTNPGQFAVYSADNYPIKVEANNGYEIVSVKVDGNEPSMIDGVFTLNPTPKVLHRIDVVFRSTSSGTSPGPSVVGNPSYGAPTESAPVSEPVSEPGPAPEPTPTVNVGIEVGSGSDTVKAEVETVEDADGNIEMSLNFSEEIFDDLIEEAIEDLAAGETTAEISFDLTGTAFADVTVFNVSIPATSFEGVGKTINVVITTEFGTMTVSSDVLLALMKTHGDVITLTIRKSSFVIEFTDSRGNPISWSDPENPILVELPYELGEDEDPGLVVAVRVGAVYNVAIPYSVYRNGNVAFEITRTGTYDVIYDDSMEFADVEGHWSAGHVGFLAARGLLEEADDFGVGEGVTRAMFAVMFATLEGVNLSSYNGLEFTDVAAGRWFTRAIDYANKTGIIEGIGGGLFAPDRLVTREDMATMLYRYINYKGWETEVRATREVPFTDYDSISDYATEAVQVIKNLGIIQGYPNGSYNPQGNITKAEYAAIFARLIQAFSK